MDGKSHPTTTVGDTKMDETEEDDEFSTLTSGQKDHITMSVTVDVSDMDIRDRTVLDVLAEMYENNFMEVVEKNRDYGFSFLRTGCKLAGTDATPFDNPTRSQAYGLLTRTGDKRERLIENVYGDGDSRVSDEPAVTAQEAANYYLFLAFVLDNPDLAAEFL